MLIQFSVTNFRSFSSTQTLSLVAENLKEPNKEANTFSPPGSNGLKLLHSAAIYGPNASGKSNLLKALACMRDIIKKPPQAEEPLPYEPFKLVAANTAMPTEFEVVFIQDGIRFQYGFSFDAMSIKSEWLFAYPKRRKQEWLVREWSDEDKSYAWSGSAVKNAKELSTLTRDNELFLSFVASRKNHLTGVYNWLIKNLHIANARGWIDGPAFTAKKLLLESTTSPTTATDIQSPSVRTFLKHAGISFDTLSVDVIEKDIPEGMPPEIATIMGAKPEKNTFKSYEVKILKKDDIGIPVEFDIDKQESDGTKRLFSLTGPWLDVLENGYILFFDELNLHLHPHLAQFLVELFHNPEINKKNAQLIFTTHDTSILGQDIFRRDQIWFCDKNVQQATDLYPLTDFHPRDSERENTELRYLNGRYNAIPYISTLDAKE